MLVKNGADQWMVAAVVIQKSSTTRSTTLSYFEKLEEVEIVKYGSTQIQ